MFNFINFPKITATSLLVILLTGFFLAQPSTAGKEEKTDCKNNNGIGNNYDLEYTIDQEIRSIRIDPGNKGQMSKFRSELAAEGFSQTQIDNAVAQLWDAEKKAKGSGKKCQADITVTIEEPGVQEDRLLDKLFIIDFDNVPLGEQGFKATVGSTEITYDAQLKITQADVWGGANGSRYITNSSGKGGYTITINEEQKYYGFWWSAGDPYNQITFKKDGEEIAVFQTSDLVDFINNSEAIDKSKYYGNPNGNNIEASLKEPYSFVNVFFNDGGYDEIVIETMTDSGAAFESDNHSFSANKQDVRGEIVIGEKSEGDDPDGDGLEDSYENIADANGDGQSDVSVKDLSPDGTIEDVDGDGTPNYLDEDSDQDGLTDIKELELSASILQIKYKTLLQQLKSNSANKPQLTFNPYIPNYAD